MTDISHNDRVSAYLDHELSAEQRRAFEEQLQRDPELQQTLASFETIRGALREAEPDISEDFIAQTRARMERAQLAASTARPRTFPWRGAGLAAAALLGSVLFVTQWDVIATQLQTAASSEQPQSQNDQAPAPFAPTDAREPVVAQGVADELLDEEMIERPAGADPDLLGKVVAKPSRAKQAAAKMENSPAAALERMDVRKSKPSAATRQAPLAQDADGVVAESKAAAHDLATLETADAKALLKERTESSNPQADTFADTATRARETARTEQRAVQRSPAPPVRKKIARPTPTHQEVASEESDRSSSEPTSEAEVAQSAAIDDAALAALQLNAAKALNALVVESGWLQGRRVAVARIDWDPFAALKRLDSFAESTPSIESLQLKLIRIQEELMTPVTQDEDSRKWADEQLAAGSLLQLALPTGLLCEARLRDTTLTLRRARSAAALATTGEATAALCLIPVARDQLLPTQLLVEGALRE